MAIFLPKNFLRKKQRKKFAFNENCFIFVPSNKLITTQSKKMKPEIIAVLQRHLDKVQEDANEGLSKATDNWWNDAFTFDYYQDYVLSKKIEQILSIRIERYSSKEEIRHEEFSKGASANLERLIQNLSSLRINSSTSMFREANFQVDREVLKFEFKLLEELADKFDLLSGSEMTVLRTISWRL